MAMLGCCTCDNSELDETVKAAPALPSKWAEVPLSPTKGVSGIRAAWNPDEDPDVDGAEDLAVTTPAEKFKFHLMRATQTTGWGVDFSSHSTNTLTIAAIEPGKAIAESNVVARTYAARPLKPGDVIVSIDGATTQAEMIEKLKRETSLTADIVRYSKFDVVLEKTADPTESFGMNLNHIVVCDTNLKTLSIDKIDPKASPVQRYNEQNYLKPLIRGDVIVAVDSITAPDEMIKQIKTSAKVTLSIERHQRFGQKLPRAAPAPTIDGRVDSGREIAEAA